MALRHPTNRRLILDWDLQPLGQVRNTFEEAIEYEVAKPAVAKFTISMENQASGLLVDPDMRRLLLMQRWNPYLSQFDTTFLGPVLATSIVFGKHLPTLACVAQDVSWRLGLKLAEDVERPPNWAIGVHYDAGAKVWYQRRTYITATAHTSTDDKTRPDGPPQPPDSQYAAASFWEEYGYLSPAGMKFKAPTSKIIKDFVNRSSVEDKVQWVRASDQNWPHSGEKPTEYAFEAGITVAKALDDMELAARLDYSHLGELYTVPEELRQSVFTRINGQPTSLVLAQKPVLGDLIPGNGVDRTKGDKMVSFDFAIGTKSVSEGSLTFDLSAVANRIFNFDGSHDPYVITANNVLSQQEFGAVFEAVISDSMADPNLRLGLASLNASVRGYARKQITLTPIRSERTGTQGVEGRIRRNAPIPKIDYDVGDWVIVNIYLKAYDPQPLFSLRTRIWAMSVSSNPEKVTLTLSALG